MSGINTFLCIFGLSRAASLFIDPYGSLEVPIKEKIAVHKSRCIVPTVPERVSTEACTIQIINNGRLINFF